jgi:signal transduction histidine kinase
VLLAKTLSSSTFKLALIAIGAFGIVVLALFSYVYFSTASYVRSRSDRAIMTEQSSLVAAYARSGRDGLIDLIRQRTANRLATDDFYLLADSSLAALAGDVERWPPALARTNGWAEFRSSASASNAATQPLVRAQLVTLPNGDRLLVGRDISELDTFTSQIRMALVAVIILMFVLGTLTSVLVTRRTVGRIEAINATSRDIMLNGLENRIPLRGTHDEWDRVAENLNRMLDRIAALMGEIKQVSDNVAHDLRTPLTRMRGRLEKAFHAGRNAEQDQTLIGDTLAELDAVLRMFTSITRIAEIETRARKGAFRHVNLVEIASEVVELYDAAAEQDGTSLTLAGDKGEVVLTGDRDLLFDAIANLVDNAIKHGRRGGRVIVACEKGDGVAEISVADDGPGIPAAQHENVFKRFYRIEQSRYRPGNGLGLNLVAAVAHLHDAKIEMRDNAPGLLVTLSFSTTQAADVSRR